MAIANTMAWRVRASGSNVNGGGFNSAQSGALATTLNGAITAGATTVVVASATGWPASGNYHAQIGNAGAEPSGGGSEIVLVTGGQGTTSWTVTRAQLGTTALAFATGITVSNELSRGTTAAFSGTDGTSNASTTFTSATGAFNETVVGNVLWLASGTNGTVGPYLITGYTNSTTITLDRNCSTGAMTNGAFKIGGAWVDPRTNCESATNIKPGNQIYIRAGGSGSVASPDFTNPTLYVQPPTGDTTNGYIKFIGENGRPYWKGTASNIVLYAQNGFIWCENFYLISGSTTNPDYGMFSTAASLAAGGKCVALNLICDQNGTDVTGLNIIGTIDSCEVFTSTANGGAAGSQYAIAQNATNGCSIRNTNIHDTWGKGLQGGVFFNVLGCIISKCKGDSVTVAGSAAVTSAGFALDNCTIDGGSGHGVVLTDGTSLAALAMRGCIISNHAGASKDAIHCNTGTTAANDRIRNIFDYNSFYNNTANTNALTVGTSMVNGSTLHDNVGTDPGFVGQSTENYAIGAALKALGFPQTAFLQTKSGQTTGVRNYADAGGVMRQEPNTFPLVHPGMIGGLHG